MPDSLLFCPQCKCEIPLTESLAAPLLENARKQFQAQLLAKDQQIISREDALAKQRETLMKAQRELQTTVTAAVSEKLTAERAQIISEEAQKAKAAAALELQTQAQRAVEAETLLRDREAKLAIAQTAEAEFRKKSRELADQQRELELTIEKRINAGLSQAQEEAQKKAEENLKLKVSEKETTIKQLQQQIEILRQKADQGSQQLQGEVQELELELVLTQGFPTDLIEPVPKGKFGGDVVQNVFNPSGQNCGVILWEFKRTKAWNDQWLVKLREDQRTAKAEISVLISQTLPKGVELFQQLDGVWIAHPRAILPVASVLRHCLQQLKMVRLSTEGRQSKTELVYEYLTGPSFRQRVEALVEAFTSMREDLNRERQVITKQWAKREKQIENVTFATVGMWGDLQAISGRSLQELAALELDALSADENSNLREVPASKAVALAAIDEAPVPPEAEPASTELTAPGGDSTAQFTLF